MASRDLLEFQGVRGNQLSLWNVHHVPLGIEARPDLSKTQDYDGGRTQ